MELKEYKYPPVHVEEFSEIDPYDEGTQTCCLFQLRRKDIQMDYRTRVEGLDDDLVHKNILVDLKKGCQCKGKIVRDGKHGRMIQLEGDKASKVTEFLLRQGITHKGPSS